MVNYLVQLSVVFQQVLFLLFELFAFVRDLRTMVGVLVVAFHVHFSEGQRLLYLLRAVFRVSLMGRVARLEQNLLVSMVRLFAAVPQDSVFRIVLVLVMIFHNYKNLTQKMK